MIRVVNALVQGALSALLRPFDAFSSRWPALIAASLLAACLVMLVFRLVSNPALIRRRRRRLLAAILELALFKNDAVVAFGACGRVAAAWALYFSSLLVPSLACLAVVAGLVVHLPPWFGFRPLRAGEETVVTVRLKDEFPVLRQDISLQGLEGGRPVTEAVRSPSRNEVSWRVRAENARTCRLQLVIGGTAMEIGLDAGPGFRPASCEVAVGQGWGAFLNPTALVLPAAHPVRSVRVAYSPARLRLGPYRLGWLPAFFVVTLCLSLPLKRLLNVEM